jgi:long-chain acyl-CoA synthetase
MLMSGGTTGTPKVVLGTHRCFTAAGEQLKVWLHRPADAPEDIALVPLPLFHVYACVGVQSHSFVNRTPMALVPNPRDIDDLLKTIEQVRPTLFSAVPALFIALLNHPKVKARRIDFSSIRCCFSGAAPLMAATKEQFESLTGGRIVEGYSLTEAMMACLVNPMNGINKLGSVGIPLPDVEVAIVDVDTGHTFLPRGEMGEVIVRAPQLMSGYYNNPEETARALRTHDAGGPWLHTGDLGYLDEDSFLFIVDRHKDLIKTSGYQVWPREIEEVLASHPGVQEVGVAGVPDELKGEVVKAWVVARAGTDLSIDELRAYCRQKLAPYKAPVHVEFRDALPKNMAGKVLRRVLVAEHKREK